MPEKNNKESILKLLSKDLDIGCQGYIDVDNFREFNLKFSYSQGDESLKRLEKLIKEEVSPNCLVRIGSDEFYFSLISDFKSTKENIFNLFQRILNELGFTVSIGVTEQKGLLPEALLYKLKQNTQIAKINGKNKLYIE